MTVPSLAAFLGPGLALVSGAPAIARRIAVAAVAAGFLVPPLLAVPAQAAGSAHFERVPVITGEVAADEGPNLDPAVMRKLIEGSGPFVAAALRHGLDPERFLTIALVTRQLRDESVEINRVRLAPILGRKGELGRLADPSAARWLDLVTRHGRKAGAGFALDALDTAQAAEAGKRRKPGVEAVMRRIVEMRADPDFEAEILAMEYVAVRDGLPDGFDRLPESHAYMALSFGPERLFEIARTVELAQSQPSARLPAAYRVLGVAADANSLLTLDDGKGARGPLTAADFVQRLDIEVAKMREIAKAVSERTTAEAAPLPGTPGHA